MKTFYTALMLAAVSLGAMGTAMADDITADVLTYDGKTKVVSAKGNVVIHANEGATITGTNGEYHFEDRSAFLEGGVKYVKEQSTLTAEKMYLYKDRTARGIGSVDFVDLSEHRILRGDDVMYNAATGFGKIEGNGYLETADGTLSAPQSKSQQRVLYPDKQKQHDAHQHDKQRGGLWRSGRLYPFREGWHRRKDGAFRQRLGESEWQYL